VRPTDPKVLEDRAERTARPRGGDRGSIEFLCGQQSVAHHHVAERAARSVGSTVDDGFLPEDDRAALARPLEVLVAAAAVDIQLSQDLGDTTFRKNALHRPSSVRDAAVNPG
jgi:hypothetical protein